MWATGNDSPPLSARMRPCQTSSTPDKPAGSETAASDVGWPGPGNLDLPERYVECSEFPETRNAAPSWPCRTEAEHSVGQVGGADGRARGPVGILRDARRSPVAGGVMWSVI